VTGIRVKHLISSWRSRGNSGSAAVEFAFVAPVFFVFLFGIIEGGIIFFGQTALMNATQDAARAIRTGQAQGGTINKDDFKAKICSGISGLFRADTGCGNLQVDVQNYPAGFSNGQTSPIDGSGNLLAGQDRYNTGGPCDVVIVRAFYKYTIITPLMWPILGGNSAGARYLTAAAVFRNEPFNAAVQGC
jgi:Flp pilus assembly protein TadG